MKIGLKIDGLADAMTLEQRIDDARAAATAGFAAVWSSEPTNCDALTALALIGREVPEIGLGTSIVHTTSRHPMVLANQALTVQAATGNRLTLGVGPGAQFLVETHYGLPYAKPARHLWDYLAVLAPLLRGEEVAFAGETLAAEGSVAVPGAAPPPLLISALGPVMLRLAGEAADGTVTAFTGPTALGGYVVPTISDAAAAAGRPAPRIAAGVTVCVTDDEAGARGALAEQIGFFGDMPSYRAMLDREGVAGVADVALVGDERAVEEGVRRYAEAGATDLIASPFGSAAERTRTIGLLASLARAGSGHRALAAA